MALQTWAALNAQNSKNIIPPAQSQPGIIGKTSNFFNNLSAHMASFGEGVLSPLTKGIASGVRAAQATPDILGAGINAVQGNSDAANAGIQSANQTMGQPLNMGLQNGPQATMQGSTPVQNLGTAAQAASFLVPATRVGAVGGSAIAGGLQTGGQAAENPNATAGGVIANTVGGAVLGAGLGAAAKYGPDLLSKSGEVSAPSEAPIPQASKLTPEMQNLQGEVNHAQTATQQATAEAQSAAQAREGTVQPAVSGTSDVTSGVQQGEKNLGAAFAQAPAKIEATDPTLRYNLSQQDLASLNTIKEDRKFSLPDYLNQDNNPQPNIAGQNLDMTKMNPKLKAQIEAATGQMQGETAKSLTPTQTQDLIKQLNAKTYNPVTGEVDHRIIDLTNKIKSGAQASFGHIVDTNGESVWNKAYQDYAQGTQTVNNFKTLLGINPNKDLTDVSPNKLLNKVLDLGQTPEGKVQLTNTINDIKSQTGIDLTDPVKAIQQVADKQTALDLANKNMTDAQKTLAQAQRQADLQQIKETIKNSTFKGRNPGVANMLQFMAKRAIWGVTGGLLMSVFVYSYARKLLSSTTTKGKALK